MSRHPNLPALLSFLVGIAYRLERLDQAHFLPLLDLPNDSVRYLTNMVEAVLRATSKDQWANQFAEAFLEDMYRFLTPIRNGDYLEWFTIMGTEESGSYLRLRARKNVSSVAEAIYTRHAHRIDECIGEILKTPDTGLTPQVL